jgi:hypothetical protein
VEIVKWDVQAAGDGKPVNAKKPDEKRSMRDQLSIAAKLIERCIFLIRGHEVMIDAYLADLYEDGAWLLSRLHQKSLSTTCGV